MKVGYTCWAFSCCACQQQITLREIWFSDHGEILLVGYCKPCKQDIRVAKTLEDFKACRDEAVASTDESFLHQMNIVWPAEGAD